MSERAGRKVVISTVGEKVHAFLPHPLPPKQKVVLNDVDHDLVEQANRALGRLDGIVDVLPDASLFVYFYVRKEALLSSQIEGTQSSLSDLLLFEAEHARAPSADVAEVSNYVAATEHGLAMLRAGQPISVRLIREVHAILLREGRGENKSPGEFRTSQNWIGGTRPGNATFVPPPPEHVARCMSDLEKFINDVPTRTPLLMKAALAHVQFETIHPFLDGNGRVGRLLITLLLCAERALSQPNLYLSMFFKANRTRYYELLQRVRTDGAFEPWIRFFLEGVLATADEAVSTAKRLRALFETYRQRISKNLGRGAANALRVHEYLQKHPYAEIPSATTALGLSEPTVGAAMERLEGLNVVREITGRRRDRIYAYDEYIKILSEGADPLARA